MKKIVFLASVMGLSLLLASVAFAHGGQYSGPAGGGSAGGFAPAGAGTPGPGPGPAGGGTPGAGTPGGGGGTTGGGAPTGGGPARPGGSGGGTGGGGAPVGRGGTTGGGAKKGASDANATWAAWWFFNDDKYLNLKARVRANETETDNADIFVGESGVDTVTRVPAKKIRDGVNPTLTFALGDPYFDTRAAAAIALGKTGMPEALGSLVELLSDEDKRVRESACLAMGILGAKEAVPTLIDVMNDAKVMRKKMREGGDVLTRTRSFAAMAIGLIGARETDLSDTQALPMLMEMVKAKSTPHRDLKVAPIVALGIMRSKEAVPTLIEFLKEKDNNNWARAYAATSLGKIGDPSAIPILVKSLRDKQNAVVQSAAIALGMLVDKDDKKIMRSIQKMVKSGRDLSAKNFSIVALGEIGGVENRNFLTRMVTKGNRFEKTFAAMGLAVYFHKNEGDPEKLEVAKMLHKELNSVKNPDERGAYSIALGVMRYDTAGADITKLLKKGGQASMRSHLCVSLGLMNYDKGISAIREVVIERGDVDLRRNASIALGLLGDRSAMDFLRKEMENSANSLPVLGAVTQGLGFIGDVSAVPTLVKMVKDRQAYKDNTRAFSAVALGLLGDKDSIPILSKIAENNNYLTRTDAIAELLTIL